MQFEIFESALTLTFHGLMLSGFKIFEQQARFDPDRGWGGESYIM